MIRQVRSGFVPLLLEHLEYLPPIGRWTDGYLADTDDGEAELVLLGGQLRHLVQGDANAADPFRLIDRLDTTTEIPDTTLSLTFEPRSFGSSAVQEIHESAPVPAREHSKWSELPPLIWTLAISLAAVGSWAAAKFAGAFFEEVGRMSGKAFAEWLGRMWNSAEEPKRDRMLAVQFRLPDDVVVTAYVTVAHDDDDANTHLANALDRLGDVPAFVGLQLDRRVLGDIVQASLFYDGDWHIGWWTDGQTVHRTRWFEQHAPDPSRFLGRPLLGEPPEEDRDDLNQN
jgi:hypothetical protein